MTRDVTATALTQTIIGRFKPSLTANQEHQSKAAALFGAKPTPKMMEAEFVIAGTDQSVTDRLAVMLDAAALSTKAAFVREETGKPDTTHKTIKISLTPQEYSQMVAANTQATEHSRPNQERA